jgi:competence protein ComEC
MQNYRGLKIFVLILLAAAVLFAYLIFSGGKEILEVDFLDVGQGDAALLHIGKNTQILIDGGPSEAILLERLGEMMPVGDRGIEVVILTHPDSDHYVGLIGVLKYYQVGIFLDSGRQEDSAEFATLENLLKEKGIRREILLKEANIKVGEKFLCEVFAPDSKVAFADDNEASLVMKMSYEKHSFLFTGDGEIQAEQELIHSGKNLASEWLKVSHHGSKNATSAVFLEEINPKSAVISVGKDNRFGHPTPEVLERLQSAGVKVFRTDEQGTVRVVCDEECRVE